MFICLWHVISTRFRVIRLRVRSSLAFSHLSQMLIVSVTEAEEEGFFNWGLDKTMFWFCSGATRLTALLVNQRILNWFHITVRWVTGFHRFSAHLLMTWVSGEELERENCRARPLKKKIGEFFDSVIERTYGQERRLSQCIHSRASQRG